MLIFDIGANVGAWALANISEDNTIVSVEASPVTYVSLKKNTEGFKNIHPLNFAVCSCDSSTTTFYHCMAANTLSTLDRDWLSSPESRFENFKNSIVEIIVPTKSLDMLIEEYGIPELIKIDVEGAENIVLQSLSRTVNSLCFEWAAEWKDKNIQCIYRLVDLGFTKFSVQHQDKYTYRPSEFKETSESIISFLNSAEPKKDWGMIWATV